MLQPDISKTVNQATPLSADSAIVHFPAVLTGASASDCPVGDLAKSRSYAKGDHIYLQDDEATRAYQVVSGFVCLYQLTADGRRQILEFLSEGQYFGLGQDTYDCFAEAVGKSVVAAFPLNELQKRASTKPEISAWLLQQARQKMRSAQKHVILLSRTRAASRLATFISQWLGEENSSLVDGNKVHLPMTRKDLADYLGMSFETVSRAFSELKRYGIVSLPSAYDVIVHDDEKLTDVSEGLTPEEAGRAWAA